MCTNEVRDSAFPGFPFTLWLLEITLRNKKYLSEKKIFYFFLPSSLFFFSIFFIFLPLLLPSSSLPPSLPC